MIDSPYIYVSGIGEPLYFNDSSKVDVNLGLPDSFGQVWIASINANFGFNSTPHSLELELVAPDKIPVKIDSINQPCAIKVGAMYFKGYVTHVDTDISANGYVTRVRCEDGRKIDLNKYLIHTEPLLKSNLENVIVVPKELNTGGDLYTVNSPLWLMANYGATYGEIYTAVMNWGIVKLPSPGIIINKLGNLEAYRWSFNLTPLFDALLQIFDDCGFDVYYYDGEIKLVDRSKPISIDKTFFQDKYKINWRQGYDYTDRPGKYIVLGAKKEGSVGTIPFCQYHNLVDLGAARLLPAWNDIQIVYHDHNGKLQKYYPTDDELKMALKSIEHWVYYKRQELLSKGDDLPRGWMESRLDPDAYGLTGSTLDAAISFGGGRDDVYRVIHNRRAEACNWLCAWYEAVARHARTYYGKLYYCQPSEEFLRNCSIIDAAWVHDNVDNIQIDDVLSPFYEDGRISAFVKIPRSQVKGFGVDGTSTPASYVEWNEDNDFIYLPVDVMLYSPTNNRSVFPGIEDTRIFVSLPEIVVSGVELHPMLANLQTLQAFSYNNNQYLASSGSIEDRYQLYLTAKDMNDPRITIIPLGFIDQFLIPVQYNIRYGDDGSTIRGSGLYNYRGEIDDKYAPWTRQNPISPIDDMTQKAEQITASDYRDEFLEVTVAELPEINFFANFSNENSEPVYPFTSINVSVGAAGLTTRYSAKSQIYEILRLNKIEFSRWKSRLDRIQHFANLSKLLTDLQANLELAATNLSKLRKPPFRRVFLSIESSRPREEEERPEIEQRNFVRMVTITDIAYAYVADPNGGGNNVRMEFYRGVDDQGNEWPAPWHYVEGYQSMGVAAGEQRDPRTLLIGFNEETTRIRMRYHGYAMCVDGYLRRGMPAMFHHEDINGTTFDYFTGGVRLEEAKVVRLLTAPQKNANGYYYADVETISHIGAEPFRFYKVPFVNNDFVYLQSYKAGDLVQVVHNTMTTSNSASTAADGGSPLTIDRGTLRPDSEHLRSDGEPVGDLFINNPPTVNAVAVVVINPPNPVTGRGGLVAAVGDETVQFGKITGSAQEEELYFVGCPPNLIYEGDYGILVPGLSSSESSARRWFVIIQKPVFTPYGEM